MTVDDFGRLDKCSLWNSLIYMKREHKVFNYYAVLELVGMYASRSLILFGLFCVFANSGMNNSLSVLNK